MSTSKAAAPACTSLRGMPISTKDGWSGRIEATVDGRSVVAIQDGLAPNDDLAGYRTFNRSAVSIIGGQAFVSKARAPGCVVLFGSALDPLGWRTLGEAVADHKDGP